MAARRPSRVTVLPHHRAAVTRTPVNELGRLIGAIVEKTDAISGAPERGTPVETVTAACAS
jgi:hypothetical protein